MMKIKRLLAGMTALALSATALAACSDTKSEAENEDKDFVVGFTWENPPYGYVGTDGSYTGFDLELAQEVAKRNGWTFTAEPLEDWGAKDAQLDSGAVDVLWNGFTLEGREGKYAFSEPYMLNEQVVVVKADSSINSLTDLAGKKVAVEADSAASTVLGTPEADGGKKELADTFASLETVDSSSYSAGAFDQLKSGTVDAVVCDYSVAAYQLTGNPDVYRQLESPLATMHYAVAFKTGDDERAKKVSETLKAMETDGFIKKLCDKYANQGISYDKWVLGKAQ